MNTLKDWNCEVNVSGEAPITVGQPFAIVCEGATPLDTSAEILVFPDNEKVQYDLVVLDKKFQSDNKIFIKATSWKTGNKNLQDYTLVVGDSVIDVRGPKYTVKSVLESDTEMNLPPGVAAQNLPLVAVVALWASLLLLGIGVFFWFYLNKKYDRALLKLHALKTSLAPYHEFNKQLRVLDMQMSALDDFSQAQGSVQNWVKHLESALMNYMSLTINEPLFFYKTQTKMKRVIKRSFRKKKVSNELLNNYFEVLKEIESLVDATTNQNFNTVELVRDLRSTIEISRDFVDQMHKGLESEHA